MIAWTLLGWVMLDGAWVYFVGFPGGFLLTLCGLYKVLINRLVLYVGFCGPFMCVDMVNLMECWWFTVLEYVYSFS